ncbi:MAG TPA: hypothetical protein VGI81_11910 [Tepidisphaeraceae bacterium]|jgi:hypothetical protein
MKLRYAPAAALMTLTALLAGGCGGGGGNVQAVAPGPNDRLSSVAPQSGSYNLYRATNTDQDKEPTLERIWTVSVSRGDRLGFNWQTIPAQRWVPDKGFHLTAYAGSQSRDLGPYTTRSVKYVWAATTDDVMGYFHGRNADHSMGNEQ